MSLTGNLADVAIVDLSLGPDSGLRLVEQVAASLPAVRVLVLSMYDETLHAEVLRHERPERLHRPAKLAAEDRAELLRLLV